MPEWIRPAFGLRYFAVRQAGDERFQAVKRQHFAAGLTGEALQQRTIDRQRAEFLGFGLDRPAGVALADLAAVGGGDRDSGSISAANAGRKRSHVRARRFVARFGDHLALALTGW